MKELTELLEPHADQMDLAFREGVIAARCHKPGAFHATAKAHWASVRARYGFAEAPTPLLTPPDGNAKLDKATTLSYGLTLQHYVTKLTTGLTVNGCPNAGHCIKVCVLNNGNGSFPAVIRARKAKTEFLVEKPELFCFLLGFELACASKRFGKILFRPNVNSDVAWERLLPSLTDGVVLPEVMSYGYSKRPEVLDTNGWLGSAYRVAYSWNETSDKTAVRKFVNRGGSCAVVTSRKKGEHVGRRFPFATQNSVMDVLDGDVTDEWLLQEGVIGDLSAKGKARKLIGKSGFVVEV